MRMNEGNKSLLIAAAFAASSMDACASAKYESSDDQYVTFSAGTRYSCSHAERPESTGGGHVNDPNLDSARLLFGASLNKYLKATFHTEWDGAA